jgi:hypothetical protein
MANPTEIAVMKRNCEISLDQYVIQARKTCSMLSRFPIYPLTESERHKLNEQRIQELEAYEYYMFARGLLLAEAGVGPNG